MTRADRMQCFDGPSILRQSTVGSSASNDPFSSNIDGKTAEQGEEKEDKDEDEGTDSDSDSDSNESESEFPRDKSNAQDAYKCNSCGKSCPDQEKLTEHKRDHFSGRCEICNKSFTTASGIRQHILRKHKDFEPSRCPARDCNYSNKIECRVISHIEKKHPKLVPEFSEVGSIKQYHNRKHAIVEDDVNLCPYCGLTFANAHDLMSHMLIHEAEAKRLLCPAAKCNTSFLEVSSLIAHISTYHPRFDVVQEGKGPAQKCHICEQCNKAFPYPSELERHKDTHLTQRERLPCPIADCSCSYGRKGDLKRHIESKHPDVEIEKRPSTS